MYCVWVEIHASVSLLNFLSREMFIFSGASILYGISQLSSAAEIRQPKLFVVTLSMYLAKSKFKYYIYYDIDVKMLIYYTVSL